MMMIIIIIIIRTTITTVITFIVTVVIIKIIKKLQIKKRTNKENYNLMELTEFIASISAPLLSSSSITSTWPL